MSRRYTNAGSVGTSIQKALLVSLAIILASQQPLGAQTTASVYNGSTGDQRSLVSVEFNSTPLADALHALARKATVGISYDSEAMPKKLITYRAEDTPVFKALEAILSGTGLVATLSENRKVILIKEKPVLGRAIRQETITGTVTDGQSGETLPGVNILVKGTSTGTSTDSEGNFELTVESLEDTLVVSYIGYQTQDVPIQGRTEITIEMQSQAITGEEMVVTALGIERERANISSAISEVGGEELTQAKAVNFGNALQGKISGVNASSPATGPGGSSRVLIRGNSSLIGNNQPLYIVDGVPINNENQGSAGKWGGTDQGDGLNSIDPNNIKNISVLKGGSAAALYGSRASNGVVLITTKSGKAQEGIGVEYSSTYTNERPLVFSDWQDQFGAGTNGEKPSTISGARETGAQSWGAPLDGSMVVNPDGVERSYSANSNNIKKFYDMGHAFSNSLALQGGNEVARFNFSVSNTDNNGVVPNNEFKRQIFSLNVDANISDKIIFHGYTQYNIEKGQNRSYVADTPYNPNALPMVLARSLSISDAAPGYNEEGSEIPWFSGGGGYNNPYFVVNNAKNHDTRRRFIGNFSATYNITDFLYAKTSVGIDQNNRNSKDISPSGVYLWTPGVTSNQRQFYETNAKAMLGINRTFDRFSIDALIGGTRMYRENQGVGLSSGKLNIPRDYFIRNGTNQNFQDNYSEQATNSFFGSAGIGYQDYIFLNLTGRKDWFSTLPIDKNNVFYPSAGVSFVFTSIPSWEKPSWLSYGKIRASWAEVGGGAPSPYSLDLTYTAGANRHLGQSLMSISNSTVPNKTIEPYTTTATELGIELSLFNDIIGGDITFYREETKNDIVNAAVSTASSYSSVLVNSGLIENKGIEVTLDGTPIQNKKFTWKINYNLAFNKSKVERISEGLNQLQLPSGEVRTGNAFIYHFTGKPYGQIAGYKKKRDEDGNIIYNRASGLPVQSDFMALGVGVPPWNMGISNTVNYNNFTLGFLFDAKFGGYIYSATNAYAAQFGLAKRTIESNVRENGVKVSGVDRQGQPYNATIDAEDYYKAIYNTITNEFVYDASFIKLREITLGYSLPNHLINKTPLQSIKLSIVARNVILLYSNVPNVDPESTYNTSNAQGLEMYGVPPTRSYGLNFTIQF